MNSEVKPRRIYEGFLMIENMAKDKKSFVLYSDLKHTVQKLPDEQAGKLLKHILAYVNDENPTTEDLLVEIAFEPIKQQLKRDLKKFEEKRKKWSEAGKKSAEARRMKSEQNEQTLTNVKGRSTDSTVNVNDNVNVSVNVNDITTSKEVGKERKSFSPPSIEEVEDYFFEKNCQQYKQEASKFWYHYDANGWKVGKNKMKNWKSAASGWLTRINEFKTNDNARTNQKQSESWEDYHARISSSLQD